MFVKTFFAARWNVMHGDSNTLSCGRKSTPINWWRNAFAIACVLLRKHSICADSCGVNNKSVFRRRDCVLDLISLLPAALLPAATLSAALSTTLPSTLSAALSSTLSATTLSATARLP